MNSKIEPGYTGLRPGDQWTDERGRSWRVLKLIPNPKHFCARGQMCKAAWHVVSVPIGSVNKQVKRQKDTKKDPQTRPVRAKSAGV